MALIFVLLSGLAQAQLCQRWGEPVTVGLLDKEMLPEASGLAVSRLFEGRLFHINDSDGGAYLYFTDRQGGAIRQISIELRAPFTTVELVRLDCLK